MFCYLRKIFCSKIVWYIGSRYLTLLLQFLSYIYIAAKLGVYYWGIWSFIILLINIGSSCHWGIGSATMILLVQKKEDQLLCNKYIFNAFLLLCLTFIPPLLILCYDRIIGITVFTKYHLNNLIYAVAAVIILQYISMFFVNIFRAKNKIIEIIIQQSLWPLVMFCLIFLASGKKLLYLLSALYVVVSLFVVLMFVCRRIVSFSSAMDINMMKEIILKSFYLFIYNVCFSFIVLSTKLQVSCFYSVTEFGYFSFAFSLAQGVVLLLDSLIFLLLPKMIDMLKGNDIDQIKSAIKILRDNYLLPLHLIFYVILIVSFPFFYFMPQYSRSLLPFILILFTLIMYSNCFGYNSYLLAQNREKSFALIVFIALLANILLVHSLIRWFEVRFEYVVLGTLFVNFLYSITVNSYALYCMREYDLKVYWREIFVSKSVIIYFMALILVITIGCRWWIFAGIFIVFILIHIPQLICLIKNFVKLIHNDKLINV